MKMGLERKVALITGAGGTIGRAIALGLAKEKVNIVLNDISKTNVETIAGEVRALGCKAMISLHNITDEREVKKMVHNVVMEWGTIDILVNNAGISSAVLVEDMEKSEWSNVLDVDLNGTFNCSKAVIGTMKKRGSGKIINIASMSGLRMTMNGGAHYTAAKAAVLGFTRHLAFELGHFKINVNALCPGNVRTPLLEDLIGSEGIDNLKQQYPLGELIKPDDVANAVVFLASENARMITGCSILVDGGITLGVGYAGWDAYYAKKKRTRING